MGSVMASYNEIDGVPSHINHWLLRHGAAPGVGHLTGYITSDGDGMQMLWQTHHVAVQQRRCGAPGDSAPGIDYDLSDGSPFTARSLWQVKQGLVPMSDVDRAVSQRAGSEVPAGTVR